MVRSCVILLSSLSLLTSGCSGDSGGVHPWHGHGEAATGEACGAETGTADTDTGTGPDDTGTGTDDTGTGTDDTGAGTGTGGTGAGTGTEDTDDTGAGTGTDDTGTDEGTGIDTGTGEPIPCETFCPPVMQVDCAQKPSSLDDCVQGCETAQALCPAALAAVVQCAGEQPTWECTAYGPAPSGCGQAQLDLILCVDPKAACQVTCPGLIELSCELGPDSLPDCLQGCIEQYADGGCGPQSTALVSCVGPEPSILVCGDDGFPTADGCEAAAQAMKDCLVGD